MSAADARTTVLLATPMLAGMRDALAPRFDVLGPLPTPFREALVALPAADAARVRVLVSLGTIHVGAAQLDRLPALGLVCCLGSGYEGVDVAAARDRGVVVTHSPAANAATVADLAMGLMIASIRQMYAATDYLRRGDWALRPPVYVPRVRGLTGRRVGIYGLGAIGEKIARRAAAFETEVGYHNRKPRTDVAWPYFATLHALAEWADVLVVAVRADAGNRRTVDASVLAALGRDGHVVNIARGSVIDEAALIAALRAGVIAGAGLDVFEREPAVPAELQALPNAVLTPHIAGNTLEAQAAMERMVGANIDAFVAGRPVPTPVPGSAATCAPVAAA